jgi:hypothetical protein
MKPAGWFKLHRSIIECEAFARGSDWTMIGAWVAILARAQYKSKPTTFEGATINRGEFGFTYRLLQEEWGKSPNKLKEILDHFKTHNMIEIRTEGRCSICRVVNYKRYQSRKSSVIGSVTEDALRYQISNGSDNGSDNGSGGLSAFFSKKVKECISTEVAAPPSEHTSGNGSKLGKQPNLDSPSEVALLDFPCSGKNNGPKSWPLYQSTVDEFSEAYPAVDVMAEARKALVWVKTNPTKKKTFSGMPSFLNRWISNKQNRGGSDAGGLPQQAAYGPPKPIWRD